VTASKIAITLDENLLREVDQWVEQKLYPKLGGHQEIALAIGFNDLLSG
jgi:hypothetical protein